jgi:hypothetical protein
MEVDLSPRADKPSHCSWCQDGKPTVACLRKELACQEGVNEYLLRLHAHGVEIHIDTNCLDPCVEYEVTSPPVFRLLAPLAEEGEEVRSPWPSRPRGSHGYGDLQKEFFHSRTTPGVHPWRACKEGKWVELIVEGTSTSPYAGTRPSSSLIRQTSHETEAPLSFPLSFLFVGGAFLLRVASLACALSPAGTGAIRLMTPIYHPAVGPNGQIALLRRP